MNAESGLSAAFQTPHQVSTETISDAALFDVHRDAYGVRVEPRADDDLGRWLRDDGQRRADESVDEFWRRTADQAIAFLAATGRPFTADDVHEIGVPKPISANAMGPRFSSAARRGLITKVGYQPGRRPELRATVLAVWRGVT